MSRTSTSVTLASLGEKHIRRLQSNKLEQLLCPCCPHEDVRPAIAREFRALTAPRDTLVGGSSMGGLISLYFGYSTDVFGGVMAMSPAITRAPHFTAALAGEARRPIRIYGDTGTSEGSVGPGGGDYWHKPWEAYTILLRQNYAVNDDLLMRAGCGHVHHESAWSARFTEAMRFLLDIRLEAGGLDRAGWDMAAER